MRSTCPPTIGPSKPGTSSRSRTSTSRRGSSSDSRRRPSRTCTSRTASPHERNAWRRVSGGPRMARMKTLQARVVNGKFVIDEPSPFPDGTVLQLMVADEADELDDDERAELHAVLDKAWASARAGRGRPAEDLI